MHLQRRFLIAGAMILGACGSAVSQQTREPQPTPHAENDRSGEAQAFEGEEGETLTLAAPVIMGSLSREAVQAVIDRSKGQVRFCYERRLYAKRDLEGRVLASWIIGPSGAVTKVQIKDSTVADPELERCIVERIGAWLFPAPAGGGVVEVNYPFVLRHD